LCNAQYRTDQPKMANFPNPAFLIRAGASSQHGRAGFGLCKGGKARMAGLS